MVGRPLRRFATAGSGMVAGRTDRPSGPPKTASFVVEKAAEGGGQNSNETRRAIERARAGIGMNGYFGNLMEPSSTRLSHCVLCGRSEDVAYFPSSAHVKHGPFVAGERPTDRGGQRRFRRRQRHSCSFIRSGKFVSPKVLVPAR